ncbi:MAG: type I-PGING CRISPR-associated protein Cas7/Csp1, partial [Bacteroidota bacterium]
SNGDGVTGNLSDDIRSDLGGFLITEKGEYSGRRTAPMTATPATAIKKSDIGRDLLVRLKQNTNEDSDKKQALATNEFSQRDEMVMNFHLDVPEVGGRREFTYEKELHLGTKFNKMVDDAEHARRVRLFLEGTRSMNDYANQARNAVSGEPTKALVILDTKMSRKAIRYFAMETTEEERANILKELDARGAKYFLGDDTDPDGDSVHEAFEKALKELNASTLVRPV